MTTTVDGFTGTSGVVASINSTSVGLSVLVILPGVRRALILRIPVPLSRSGPVMSGG